MELALYFLFVVVAIGSMAWLLNFLGQSKAATYSVEEAKAHFLTAYPEEVPGDAREAAGAVLFALEGNRLAIVRPMGKFPVVRLLSRPELVTIVVTGQGICLRTNDYSDPSIQLSSEDGSALKTWIEERLQP